MNEDENVLPCAEKITYDTKPAAEGAAAAADWQHGASLKAYKCRHCHLWHLATHFK
jgi:hypothetical protein